MTTMSFVCARCHRLRLRSVPWADAAATLALLSQKHPIHTEFHRDKQRKAGYTRLGCGAAWRVRHRPRPIEAAAMHATCLLLLFLEYYMSLYVNSGSTEDISVLHPPVFCCHPTAAFAPHLDGRAPPHPHVLGPLDAACTALTIGAWGFCGEGSLRALGSARRRLKLARLAGV